MHGPLRLSSLIGDARNPMFKKPLPSTALACPTETRFAVRARHEFVVKQWQAGRDSFWIAVNIFGDRRAEPEVARVINEHLDRKAIDNEWNRSTPVPVHGERSGGDIPE